MNTEKKIALIIDCDNAKADAIYGIMEELSAFGEISIRRAYGDWSKQNSWQEILNPFAIQPIQQFPYTPHKNATDLAMTIDAMEILFTESIDYFAIVSSDSDFTPLAMKLRAKSKQVIGFGEQSKHCIHLSIPAIRLSTLTNLKSLAKQTLLLIKLNLVNEINFAAI